MSVPPTRKSWAGPAAEGALVLAVVGLLFVAALAGFLVGRGSAEDDDSPAAAETQTTAETATEGAATTEATTTEATETEGGEDSARHIDPGSLFVGALRDTSQRNENDDDGNGQIDKENRPPRNVFDQPSAKQRSDRRCDRAKTRPCPDRSSSLFVGKRIADDRETSRNKEGRAYSLKSARRDQLPDVRGQTTSAGSRREKDDAGNKDAPASILVAERTTDQQEGGKEKRVRLNHPLHIQCGRIQPRLQER